MFQTDRVVWGVSIYWLVCGVSVEEMSWSISMVCKAWGVS